MDHFLKSLYWIYYSMSSILCFDFLAIRHVRPHSLHWKAKASLLDSSGKSQALDFKKRKTRSLYVSVCFSSTVMHQPVERSDYLFCQGGIKSCGLPMWLSMKESACPCRRHGFDPWAGKSPWRGKRQPTPVFLPGKSHEQRNLAGPGGPWGCKRVGYGLATKQQQRLYSYLKMLLM